MAWHLSGTTVLFDTICSETLALGSVTAFIVLGSGAEGVIGAGHSAVHGGLSSGLLGEASVSSRRGRGLFGSRLGCSSGVVDCDTLGVGLVLRCIVVNVPRRVHHLLEVVLVVDAC